MGVRGEIEFSVLCSQGSREVLREYQPVGTACDHGGVHGVLQLSQAGDVDIAHKDVLVAVGRGIKDRGNVGLAERLVSQRFCWSVLVGAGR